MENNITNNILDVTDRRLTRSQRFAYSMLGLGLAGGISTGILIHEGTVWSTAPGIIATAGVIAGTAERRRAAMVCSRAIEAAKSNKLSDVNVTTTETSQNDKIFEPDDTIGLLSSSGSAATYVLGAAVSYGAIAGIGDIDASTYGLAAAGVIASGLAFKGIRSSTNSLREHFRGQATAIRND